MAAAPLKDIVVAEGAGAMLLGGALLVWTGRATAALGLPEGPASFAVLRLVAVLLFGFGTLLWGVRRRVSDDRELLRALSIGHAVGGVVLLAQQIAIWNTRAGLLAAAIPLALAVRYTQYVVRHVRRATAIAD